MADWTDGPEYAPHDRPQAFVAPSAAPLSEPDAAAPAPEPPAGPAPASYAGPEHAPDLAGLIPPPPARRDPREAFDVAGTPLTSWSGGPKEADDHLHERRPTDPFPSSAPLVASVAPPASAWPPPSRLEDWPPPQSPPAAVPPPGFPAPAQGPYAPMPPTPYPQQGFPGAQQPGYPLPGQPAPWQAQRQPFSSVTMGDIGRAATPGVLICLVVGLLVQPLAAPLLLVAWALATRIRHRRRLIVRTFGIASAAVLVVALLDMLATTGDFDLFTLPEYANVWATFAHLGLLIAVPLIVGQALRRGEPPEDLP